MLPLLSLRSLGRFLDMHAAFGPALRYPSDPGHPAMLHCGIHLSGVVMARGHRGPLWNLIRKEPGGVAKVMAKHAVKYGRTRTKAMPAALSPAPSISARILMGKNA